MVQIQNADAIQSIRKNARLSISEGFPQDLGKTVVPVMDMTPSLQRITNFFASVDLAVTGGSTIVTTESVRETYITNIIFSFVKNATCDVASGSIGVTAVIGGVTVTLARCAVLTLTGERDCISIQFKNPVLIDKATTILHESDAFSAGAMIRSATISGFIVDVA